MKQLVASFVVVVVAAGCATVAEKKEIKAENQRDQAACEKMCEVAGDAEHDAANADACKKKCVEPPIN